MDWIYEWGVWIECTGTDYIYESALLPRCCTSHVAGICFTSLVFFFCKQLYIAPSDSSALFCMCVSGGGVRSGEELLSPRPLFEEFASVFMWIDNFLIVTCTEAKNGEWSKYWLIEMQVEEDNIPHEMKEIQRQTRLGNHVGYLQMGRSSIGFNKITNEHTVYPQRQYIQRVSEQPRERGVER